MKRKLLSIALLISVMFLTQCKKETPGTYTSYTGNVVFFVNGSIGGIPFDYQAGKNNYVMSSEYHFKDSVVDMRGSLLPDGTLKKSGFEVRIRGQQRTATATAFDPDQNLNTGNMALRDATGFRKETGKYIVSLSCDSTQGQYSSYLWIFPDGTYSNAYALEKKVDASLYPQYPVRLVTSGAFSCQSEVYHEISLEENCDAGFDVDILANFTAQLSLKNIQGNVDMVKWYHNDTLVTLSSINNSLYLGNTGEPHQISCEVYFTDGCIKKMERIISANFAVNCMTDFTYQSNKEVIYDPQQLATVELLYYDENGKKYSSYYPDAQGEFKMVGYSPYKLNEDGDPTMMIRFEADAILKSADGASITLSNAEGSFALAHP